MLKSFQESFPVYNLFCLLDLWYIGCNCLLMLCSDAPERHPECSWEVSKEPSEVLLICTWSNGYPAPTLSWHEVLEKSVIAKGPTINHTSEGTERLEIPVNRFILHEKEEVKCTGYHVTGVEKSCSINLGKTVFLQYCSNENHWMHNFIYMTQIMQNMTQICFHEICLPFLCIILPFTVCWL